MKKLLITLMSLTILGGCIFSNDNSPDHQIGSIDDFNKKYIVHEGLLEDSVQTGWVLPVRVTNDSIGVTINGRQTFGYYRFEYRIIVTVGSRGDKYRVIEFINPENKLKTVNYRKNYDRY